MDSLGGFFLFSTFLLFLCLQSTQPGEARTTISPHSHKLLTAVCKHDQDFKSFMKFLESIPRLSSVSSRKDIATIVLELATVETKNTVNFFTGLFYGKHTPTTYKQALNQCADSFHSAASDFRPGLMHGGKSSLDVVAKAFLDDEDLCEEVLVNDHVFIDSIWPKLENSKKFYTAAYVSLAALV